MTAKEILPTARALRDLLSDPNRWTQGASARNDVGAWTDVDAPRAVCWCVLGGIEKIGPPLLRGAVSRSLREYLEVTNIPDWNDKPETSHAEVMVRLNGWVAHLEAAEKVGA